MEHKEHIDLTTPCIVTGTRKRQVICIRKEEGFTNKALARLICLSYLHQPFDIGREHVVAHACNNERCINPKHLYLGTHYDNIQDQVKAGTHTDLGQYAQNSISLWKCISPSGKSIYKLGLKRASKKTGVSPARISTNSSQAKTSKNGWYFIKLRTYISSKGVIQRRIG